MTHLCRTYEEQASNIFTIHQNGFPVPINICLLLILIFLHPPKTMGTETDNISAEIYEIKDSLKLLNSLTYKYLQKAAFSANRSKVKCSDNELSDHTPFMRPRKSRAYATKAYS